MPERQQVERTCGFAVPMREHAAKNRRVLVIGIIGDVVIANKQTIQIRLTRSLGTLKHMSNTLGWVVYTVGRLHRNTNTHVAPMPLMKVVPRAAVLPKTTVPPVWQARRPAVHRR